MYNNCGKKGGLCFITMETSHLDYCVWFLIVFWTTLICLNKDYTAENLVCNDWGAVLEGGGVDAEYEGTSSLLYYLQIMKNLRTQKILN